MRKKLAIALTILSLVAIVVAWGGNYSALVRQREAREEEIASEDDDYIFDDDSIYYGYDGTDLSDAQKQMLEDYANGNVASMYYDSVQGSDASEEENDAEEATDSEDEKTAAETLEELSQITVCIDPGHGGDKHGVEATWDGNDVMEKDLNLSIALKLRSYLELKGVNVVMTRTSDKDLSLKSRVAVADKADADYFISVHNNSSSTGNVADTGCLVIATQSTYNNCYEKSHALANSVLSQLQGLGIPLTTDFNANLNGGILTRTSETGATYSDGSACDYYGIISGCTKDAIPAIIIEHCFVPNYSDYTNYLSSDEKLDALAKADADGILAVLEQ